MNDRASAQRLPLDRVSMLASRRDSRGRFERICRGFSLGALLIAGAHGATAGEALRPPAGYLRAVHLQKSSSATCAPAPAPFTTPLDFPSKYAGSGSARDVLDPEAERQYKLTTLPITQMEKGLSSLVTRFMASGNPSQLECAVTWLSAWADAQALQGEATSHTGRSLRKWSLGSLSSAYLRLKFSSSRPLEKYPEQAAHIEAWLAGVADRMALEWSPQAPLRKINNHYYWAAWAMMATAVATNRRDLLDQAVAIYHVFASQVDENGYLPNELTRASRAAQYHAYAMLPIAMVAAFGKANGVDLAAEGDHALMRLSQRTQAALENPSSFAARAGARQEEPSNSKSAWAWLEPYCWTVSCDPPLQARLVSLRPLLATRLGGDLSAVFAERVAP
ncbi:MAG: alginate lyase family protein [Gammaproteobacteria bacterium]